jgi:hypothetical protein
MSHYVVLVLTKEELQDRSKFERLLALYDKNMDVDEFDHECYCAGMQISADNEARRETERATYHIEEEAERAAVEAKLENAPPMAITDAEEWRKWVEANTNEYGAAVMAYAERWARLMQLEMADGKMVEEVAETTSYEADVEGITGFMYGYAVSILAKCWEHGEALRCWNNARWTGGTGGEMDGAINPALMAVSVAG